MATLDIEELLKEVSVDSPCGEDLEYDSDYTELTRLAQGTPERQMGDSVIPAQEPDWRAVRDAAAALFKRSKDLRVSDYLTRALLRLDGFSGLSQGLAVTHGLLTQYWDDLHPQLDEFDNFDPTIRVNILLSLSDPSTVLHGVREAPLVVSRPFGRFSLKDVQIASGQLAPPQGADPSELPDSSSVDAAFMEAPKEQLDETLAAISKCIEQVAGIEQVLTEKVGATHTVDLSALPTLLKNARHVMTERLSLRGDSSDSTAAEGEAVQSGDAAAPAQAMRPGAAHEIRSREDVVKMLDLVCAYYQKYEPSSPVPLLIQRAKRLVAKDFLDILRDLTPDGVSQAQLIGGLEPDEKSNNSRSNRR